MTSQEIRQIRDRARDRAEAIGARDVLLSRAWWQLAAAADTLDALLLRDGAARRRAAATADDGIPPIPPELDGVVGDAEVELEEEDGDEGEGETAY